MKNRQKTARLYYELKKLDPTRTENQVLENIKYEKNTNKYTDRYGWEIELTAEQILQKEKNINKVLQQKTKPRKNWK